MVVLGTPQLAATLDLGGHGKEFALQAPGARRRSGVVNMPEVEREADATVRTN